MKSPNTDKKPTNWWGRHNAPPLKFDPKPVEGGILHGYSWTSVNADRRSWFRHIRVAKVGMIAVSK